VGRKQFAALPFRVHGSELRVMLITTRRKRRWSVPKGWPIGKKKPHRTAAIEAYEEAGLRGAVAKRALGSFKHRKQRAKRKRTLDVTVFPLKVCRQESWWPEKGARKAIWMPPDQAARLVHKVQLGRLIARFAERKPRKSKGPSRR
jgi:8-oxo-dGTP pyrophosphatase MutT (NUDIX family)